MLKIKIILSLCLACLCFFAFSIQAQTSPQQDLTQLLESVKTLQAGFTQTLLNKNGSVLQKSQGQMSLMRPGKFRWESYKPNRQILVADGQKVWFYDIDLEQVTVQKQGDEHAHSPAMLLSGSVSNLLQDYRVVSLSPQRKSEQSFRLTPKSKSGFFQAVELDFQKGRLQAMRLIDNLNQSTIVRFFNVKINPGLSEQVFQFTPPQDVDVVKQS